MNIGFRTSQFHPRIKPTATDFYGGPLVRNPPANEGDTGLIPVPGNFHMTWGN